MLFPGFSLYKANHYHWLYLNSGYNYSGEIISTLHQIDKILRYSLDKRSGAKYPIYPFLKTGNYVFKSHIIDLRPISHNIHFNVAK